jgi:hypothetical protein
VLLQSKVGKRGTALKRFTIPVLQLCAKETKNCIRIGRSVFRVGSGVSCRKEGVAQGE